MKKFILSLVAVFAVSASSFAAVNNNTDNSVKSRMTKMESALQMDGYQSSVLEEATINYFLTILNNPKWKPFRVTMRPLKNRKLRKQ